MARIDRTSWSEEFTALAKDPTTDRNDCSVKAIAIALDLPYATVWAELARQGRRRGKGTKMIASRRAIESLGFSIKEWGPGDIEYLISCYPGVHAGLRNITTHHPRRFAGPWRRVVGDKTLIMASRAHMLCYKNGKVHDWSINRALRMIHIWEVTKHA